MTRVAAFLITLLCINISLAQSEKASVDLYHWWVSDGEAAALNEIITAAEQSGITVNAFPQSNFDLLRTTIIENVSFGYHPAATHWLGGAELLALKQEGALIDLPETVSNNNIKDILFPEVIEEIISDNKLSALPVGIHIQNTAFYNADIYRALDLTPPTSWDEFFIQADKIKAAGYTPLALSSEPSQLKFLLNSYLVSTADAKAYETFYNQEETMAPWRDKLIEMFTFINRLKPYTDKQHWQNKWNENTILVGEGKAAMQIIGDFAEAELRQLNLESDKDYWVQMSPGNNHVLNYGVDVFALLKVEDPERQAGQQILIETVLNPEVQKNYVTQKGGIPVRNDIEVNLEDPGWARIYQQWLKKDVRKIKMADGSNRARLATMTNLAYELWHNPDQRTVEETADLFIKISDAQITNR